ncbi:MAG: DNA polymerase subunit beta, partial [Methermicoccaceae archaeon]
MTGVPHRIRDFVVSKDGLVLSVLDYVPQEYYGGGEGIRSMLRYMPDEHGERIRRGYGKTYHKLTTEEALKKMRSIRPAWTKDVVVLPYDEVGEYLMPERELERVCEKDPMVSRLVSFFEEMGVSRKAMGITGSRLTSLSGDASDIDFVVYGKE